MDDIRVGDRVQWTNNSYFLGHRVRTGTVIEIRAGAHWARFAIVEMNDGRTNPAVVVALDRLRRVESVWVR